MRENNTLLECQKGFLFNSRYEPTDWSNNENILMYICNKGGVNIYCDIPDDLHIDDVVDIHKKMIHEMFKVCKKCEYHN